MQKKLIEIASEIVQTQVSLTPMSAADIALSLRQVFSTLQELQKAESGDISIEPQGAEAATETPAEQKVTPEASIQNDKIICLECGAEMRQLTQKHLSSHGISPKDYKKKYGFPMKTPLAAKSLTKARSRAAKKRGLPEKLKEFIEARKQSKSETSAPAPNQTPEAGKPAVVRRRRKTEQ